MTEKESSPSLALPWFLSGGIGVVSGVLVAPAIASLLPTWYLPLWLLSFWVTGGIALSLSFVVIVAVGHLAQRV